MEPANNITSSGALIMTMAMFITVEKKKVQKKKQREALAEGGVEK